MKVRKFKRLGKHENVLNDGNKIFFKMCKTLKKERKSNTMNLLFREDTAQRHYKHRNVIIKSF